VNLTPEDWRTINPIHPSKNRVTARLYSKVAKQQTKAVSGVRDTTGVSNLPSCYKDITEVFDDEVVFGFWKVQDYISPLQITTYLQLRLNASINILIDTMAQQRS
jgi:hypothetical protein